MSIFKRLADAESRAQRILHDGMADVQPLPDDAQAIDLLTKLSDRLDQLPPTRTPRELLRTIQDDPEGLALANRYARRISELNPNPATAPRNENGSWLI